MIYDMDLNLNASRHVSEFIALVRWVRGCGEVRRSTEASTIGRWRKRGLVLAYMYCMRTSVQGVNAAVALFSQRISQRMW